MCIPVAVAHASVICSKKCLSSFFFFFWTRYHNKLPLCEDTWAVQPSLYFVFFCDSPRARCLSKQSWGFHLCYISCDDKGFLLEYLAGEPL